jgi:hypothetical protein
VRTIEKERTNNGGKNKRTQNPNARLSKKSLATKASRAPKATRPGPQPHTPAQDLEHFGSWTGKPIWVPPNDSNKELANSMLNRFGLLTSKKKCWDAVSRQHRKKFTQVREFELPKASIRLPQGKLFVTVTEQENFDKIEEDIPACVQTRLDEFLAGPGKKRGVKVYYLKPLCIEVGDDLIFTTSEELNAAITKIQDDVFTQYRRRYLPHLLRHIGVGVMDGILAVPRALIKYGFNRKKREIAAYHAQLEFERRRRAMDAVNFHNGYRCDEITFDEVIGLTHPPKRADVIEHYVQEQELGSLDRKLFLLASAQTLPWFATFSLLAYKMAAAYVAAGVSVAVCDPAFVAEMPGSNGRLLKIGHFDEVGGVMHVEI